MSLPTISKRISVLRIVNVDVLAAVDEQRTQHRFRCVEQVRLQLVCVARSVGVDDLLDGIEELIAKRVEHAAAEVQAVANYRQLVEDAVLQRALECVGEIR